jgi:hypothetical protein
MGMTWRRVVSDVSGAGQWEGIEVGHEQAGLTEGEPEVQKEMDKGGWERIKVGDEIIRFGRGGMGDERR